MTFSTLVSVSYCCTHHKGHNPDGPADINGQEHAEWLEQAVNLYRARGFPVIVACTGFPGLLNVTNAPGYCERDVMWRVAKVAPIIGVPQNPGHQVGAALCIRQGLEAAGKWGYDGLIHTAEDVMPGHRILKDMAACLEEGYDYVGESWGERNDELNSQFFACRVQALVGPWDACQVTGDGHIERYLKRLLEGRRLALNKGYYRTTHNFEEWQQWQKSS